MLSPGHQFVLPWISRAERTPTAKGMKGCGAIRDGSRLIRVCRYGVAYAHTVSPCTRMLAAVIRLAITADPAQSLSLSILQPIPSKNAYCVQSMLSCCSHPPGPCHSLATRKSIAQYGTRDGPAHPRHSNPIRNLQQPGINPIRISTKYIFHMEEYKYGDTTMPTQPISSLSPCPPLNLSKGIVGWGRLCRNVQPCEN